MSVKLSIPYPISAPQLLPSPTQSPFIRFARWGNSNMREYEERRRTVKDIEDDLRRTRRFDSATKLTHSSNTNKTTTTTIPFKSTGTPSKPSSPSIPGRKSKYSKTHYNKYTPNNNNNNSVTHPAFRLSTNTQFKIPKLPSNGNDHITSPINEKAKLHVGEDGLSYHIDGAPFEFRYSYTESPKVKPLRLREPPFAPFGPTTMDRPWTGKKPLPPSKKKMREFDSFVLPPPHKKGVKPVQKPGPFLPGSAPRHVKTREEILGEPLTRDEISDLVNSSIKAKRQLNMGRDGLTHNMLDNIHALWKRRRVCKIKCKGVCTVDMDNVCQQLEEKTGGKIIYRKGGVLYLFRGRNYNYRYRPHFPLMLWRPITPVYPRLVKRAPEGLTLEEASEMRKKGRQLIPIWKNGVYCGLVKNVREAFEVCEMARIDCQGMNPSDYRKIGAKLKDLVPCVLISFEREHILMWRGPNWNSHIEPKNQNRNSLSTSTAIVKYDESYAKLLGNIFSKAADQPHVGPDAGSAMGEIYESGTMAECTDVPELCRKSMLDSTVIAESIENQLESSTVDTRKPGNVLETSKIDAETPARPNPTEGVLFLLKQAVESGGAMVLADATLDADGIFKTTVAFTRTAPPGPVFQRQPRKSASLDTEQVNLESNDSELKNSRVAFKKREYNNSEVKNSPVAFKKWESNVSEPKGSPMIPKKRETYKQTFKDPRSKNLEENFLEVVPQPSRLPQGSLEVDELAKLLA
ncbi:hypothetical protein ACFE04_017744 [Oxalis oulophora]